MTQGVLHYAEHLHHNNNGVTRLMLCSYQTLNTFRKFGKFKQNVQRFKRIYFLFKMFPLFLVQGVGFDLKVFACFDIIFNIKK